MKRLLRHLRRRATDERGAVLILTAIGLPAFIAFGIFVIDVGNWWVHKRHLQIQADAAALAGAREFRLPACNNQEIVEEAVDYSGGVLSDPDANFATFNGVPLGYNYQLAASARPSGPTQGLHAQVNTPDPYNRAPKPPPDGSIDDDLAAMPAANRKPCSAMMIDVKMTETDIAGAFSPLRFLNILGFIDFIDAQARVELKGLEETADLMPLAVEDVNPNKVHVQLFDEDSGELLGESDLAAAGEDNGLQMYDNSGAGIPIDLERETLNGNDATKHRIGARVVLSGTNSVVCGGATVSCYGSPTDGLIRVRGHKTGENGSGVASCSDGIDNDGDTLVDGAVGGNPLLGDPDCRGVRAGAVRIIKDACDPGPYGAHDNGYFSTTCTTANLTVELPGFAGTDSTLNRSVIAHIEDGNGTSDVALNWVAANNRWETTGSNRLPIELAAGTRRIDIEWSQRKNGTTFDNGGTSPLICAASQNSNQCFGTISDVHKAFSGSRALSGPIRHLSVDFDGVPSVNNVPRCNADEDCPHSVVVHVGLAGRLELTPLGTPPVALRISAAGPEVYQTQQLNCQPSGQTPSGRNWDPRNSAEEFAYGCEPLYRLKDDDDACPSKAGLHGSENPPAWECVAVKTGELMGPVGKGLNERILCAPLNSVGNCNNFGKADACTNPNRYPEDADDPNYPEDDPRILAFFLVPYGSLDIAGAGDTVPITNFAFFYVTGWHGNPGFANPCENAGDEFAPGSSTDDAVVSGHFIKHVLPNLGGGGTAPCNPDTIGGCVAIMTK